QRADARQHEHEDEKLAEVGGEEGGHACLQPPEIVFGIFVISASEYSIIFCVSQGRQRRRATNMATILGTKATVWSWTCVKAWARPMSRPTAMPMSKSGAPSRSEVVMACWVSEMASEGSMGESGSRRAESGKRKAESGGRRGRQSLRW